MAVEPASGQEIVLFDASRMVTTPCSATPIRRKKRRGEGRARFYKTRNGIDTFDLIVSAYYGIDYDDEFSEYVGEGGCIGLMDGTSVK